MDRRPPHDRGPGRQAPPAPARLRRVCARLWWAAAYVGALVVPLWLSTGAASRDPVLMVRWSVVVALVATSALAAAVVLPARMGSLTRSLGLGRVLGGHRYLAVLAVALVGVHIVSVVVGNPDNLDRLDLLHAPPAGRAAPVATIAPLTIVGTAVLRKRLRLGYDGWRRLHVGLAAVALVGTGLHIWWLDHLVADPGMRAWFVVLATGVLVIAGHRWVWRPPAHGRTRFIVVEVRTESPTVTTLVLEQDRSRHRLGYRPVACAPGQFASIRLRRWGLPAEHPFTIASAARPGLVSFTIRRGGPFTTTVTSLPPGTPVWLDGPHGTLSVDHTRASGLVLIAGGVGITPMISMLCTLADRGDTRPHRLILAARELDDLLFRQELAGITARLDLEITEALSRPPPLRTGQTGRVTAELLDGVLPGPLRRDQLDYFLCGAPAMVTGAHSALLALGIPASRIHTEQFAMA